MTRQPVDNSPLADENPAVGEQTAKCQVARLALVAQFPIGYHAGLSDDNRVRIYPKRHTAQRWGHPYCYDTDP